MYVDRALLKKHFGDVWLVHNSGFTRLLTECRQHVDGDMDQLLILGAIGERTLSAGRARGVPYSEFLEARRSGPSARGINTQSIADSTGIPRETVRRKVAKLVGRGWVRRNADRTLQVTQQATVELAPATQATFDYLLAIGNALLSVAAAPGAAPAEAPGDECPEA